jgi:tripartite-type tricarboxylate transporter receptor subunit TctC
MIRTILVGLVVASCGVVGPAFAQKYPSRPITFIVPVTAGGPADLVARTLAEHMRGTLGQPIIVENVTGAGGSIGTGRVARASPDGYTFGIATTATHVYNGAIYDLPYDVVTDFEPVALLGSLPHIIVTRKTFPPANLHELIGWLKQNPDAASAGTAGAGSTSHVGGLLFQKMTDTRFAFVPYRGIVPAVRDLVSGQIDLMIEPASSLTQVRSGSIKALAVAANARAAFAPEIPTVDEAGLPGFYSSVWIGLFAPKGTPKNIVSSVSAAVMQALADSAVRDRISDFGPQTPPREQQTPEALAALQKAEIQKWWPIIKAASIKGD